MSKSFYEKINLLLFVQYESEHVMKKLFISNIYMTERPIIAMVYKDRLILTISKDFAHFLKEKSRAQDTFIRIQISLLLRFIIKAYCHMYAVNLNYFSFCFTLILRLGQTNII